ncbi:MAG: glycerol-3-phosphate 1-O-acyltransferase PlsY [Bacteroidales bacterium]
MNYIITDFVFLAWMLPAVYLFGSLPTAVWIGRIFHGIDVREHGSGNAGATNVMRVLGVKTGVPVLVLDMLKGWFAVMLGNYQQLFIREDESFMILGIGLGVVAVLGHIFPVLAGFRGGKGVATIAGVCFALHPLATVSALGVFILVLLVWKYVSLGSMVAGLSFPVWIISVYGSAHRSLWIFSIVAAILLVVTHRRNIYRLSRGEENKATFLYKKQSGQ